MDLETVSKVAGIIGSVVGSGIFVKLWKGYKSRKKKGEEQRDHLNNSLLELKQQQQEIKQQLYPNGGQSLYDQILSLKFGQRNGWDLQHLAVWESDKEGKIKYVTPTLCEWIGCQRDDLMNNSWRALIREDQADYIFKRWKDCVESAAEFNESYSFKIKNRPGWYQQIEAEAVHNKDQKGVVLSSMGRFKKVGEPYHK